MFSHHFVTLYKSSTNALHLDEPFFLMVGFFKSSSTELRLIHDVCLFACFATFEVDIAVTSAPFHAFLIFLPSSPHDILYTPASQRLLPYITIVNQKKKQPCRNDYYRSSEKAGCARDHTSNSLVSNHVCYWLSYAEKKKKKLPNTTQSMFL